MIGRRTLLGAGLAVPVLGTAVATTATADPARDRHAVDATAITTVTPVGYKVTGLAIEYDGIVHSGHIDPGAFEVTATLTRPDAAPLTGARTVIGARASNRYITLDLAETDTLAAGTYNQTYTRFYDLTGAYTVRQVKNIGALPARPDVVVPNTGVRNPIVDDYASATFNGLAYRFFTPQVRPGRRYPLVVTLHGYGESGTDNFAQIAGNQLSVAFTNPARPAFVLSPQAPPGTPGTDGWWNPDLRATVIALVRSTLATNRAIDPSRVYLAGLSMGSYGSWGLLPEHHDLFAGAVLTCGAGNETAATATLGDFPIWAVHSIDDAIVPYDAPGSDYRIFTALEAAGNPITWSEWPGTAPDRTQEAYAANARARAARSRSKHLFTTLPAGTTPLFSHGSWIPTFTNDVILDWLFTQ